MYTKMTRSIQVTVTPSFLEGQSRPSEGLWVWSYQIEIENKGKDVVHLVGRHWRITDGHGQVIEVRGPGVVGDQPYIKPGSSYSYSSFTNLRTPSGIMAGSYEMEDEQGQLVLVDIPAFSLDSPQQLAMPN